MNDFRWSDLHEGLKDQFQATITATMMDAFRAISGDANPLHADPAFAMSAGHPGVVVFGLLTSALYSRLVGVHLPGRFGLLQGIDLDFVKPVFVGERLIVSGEIVHLTEACRRIEMRAKIENSAGQVVSRAKIRVGLHEH
jgi:3-hydroxybutyryl-CoA dehydratase